MLRLFLTVLATILFLGASPLAAQDSTVDYDSWERVAAQAEDLLADPNVSLDLLAQTRETLATWRARLEEAQNVNSSRIETVKQQLAALGDPPAEGESEDEEVANRRAALQKQLAELQAPRLKAVEAYSRADAIIKQIDEITAKRQALALMRTSPSPLLPTSWIAAGSDGLKVVEGITEAARKRRAQGLIWADIKPHLPRILPLLVAALLLLTYGRRWVDGLPSRLSARASENSRAVVVFLVSLGQIAIPVIGLHLLVNAAMATRLPGPYLAPFLMALPMSGLIFFGGRWLARNLFPRKAINYDSLKMDSKARSSARRMTITLSLIYAVHTLLSQAMLPGVGLYERDADRFTRIPVEFSEAGGAVWHYVLVLLAGIALFRLGNALRSLRNRDQDQSASYRHRVLAVAGGLTRLVVIAAVVLGAAGYMTIANVLVWPWTLSLGLIGLLILLQDFVADLFVMLKPGDKDAREGLAPLLTGFLLVLMSIPLFLIIWGARPTDLAEIWNDFRQGVSFGGITLSPGSVLTFLIIFAIGYSVTRAVEGALRNSILPKTRLDPGGQNAVASGVGYVGIVISALIAITSAGIDLSSLAIVAGALSVGIGFGLQNIVSNFVSGIILLIERPISVGDWISAGGQEGIVKKISVRSTGVETFDRTEVIVPNSDLISQPVINRTRHNRLGRIIIPVGVAYGSDTRRVERVLREIIEDQPLVTIDPAPQILFRGFGADSLDFEVRAVLSDVTAGLSVTSEVCHQIAERFQSEGLEIPFAQRDIWLRNPEALRRAFPCSDTTDEDGADEQGSDREGKSAPVGSAGDRKVTPTVHDPRVTFDAADDGADTPDAGDGDGDGR